MKTWVKTELYFGCNRNNGHAPVTDAEFECFLDTVVSSLLDGYTVQDAIGSWHGIPETTKLLTYYHEDSDKADASLKAVREDYKLIFDQESVLEADEDVRVSF